MKPFTNVDRFFSRMLPVTLGLALSLPLLVFTVEPNFFWIIQVAAILLIPFGVRSRLRAHRRYAEIHRTAEQRGRIKEPGLLIFTQAELDEVSLIKGQLTADVIRALNNGVQRT